MKRRLCQRTNTVGSPCRVTTLRSSGPIATRSIIHQRRMDAARGQTAARRHRGTVTGGLSGGVFSSALVSQLAHAFRAALTNGGFAGTERWMLPPCPHLPPPRPGLDWRILNAFGAGDRGDRFYGARLEYAHSLWHRQYAARAILCLDRAMGASLKGDEAVLAAWPMPYAAMVWFMRHTPRDVFIGNPRVHFQHYADRMNEPRRDQRRWRAWACWALARRAMPALHGDERHIVEEPSLKDIEARLHRHGLPGEAALWNH